MITGDNIVTAQAIAEKCNIISAEEMGDPEVCIGGPEFFEMMGGLTCKTCNKDVPYECECETKDRKERVKNMAAFRKI
jgi:magnesium-transporting ATPase (P-type)